MTWLEKSTLIIRKSDNGRILNELCRNLISIASKSELLKYLVKSMVDEYEEFDMCFCNYIIDLTTVDTSKEMLIACLEMVLLFSEKGEILNEPGDINLIKKLMTLVSCVLHPRI